MKALVLAAGLGTRLKPLTCTLPKALVEVGGKPMLWHLLAKLAAEGYDDVVVNAFHFAGNIIDYIKENDFGIRVRVSDESGELLDTGGGILKARPMLEDAEGFVVHNVDIFSDLDLKAFPASLPDGALALLSVSNRKTSRYLLFDGDMRLVGWTNAATGEVRSPFPGISPESCRRYAFSGVHYVSRDIFRAFEEGGYSGRFSIMDFYIAACARYRIYGLVSPEGTVVIDAGKPESLARAEAFVRLPC